jgi:hypothetical protein
MGVLSSASEAHLHVRVLVCDAVFPQARPLHTRSIFPALLSFSPTTAPQPRLLLTRSISPRTFPPVSDSRCGDRLTMSSITFSLRTIKGDMLLCSGAVPRC